MLNVLYNNSIAIKLLVGKVGEFWWETRLWLKLIVGHLCCLERDAFGDHDFGSLFLDAPLGSLWDGGAYVI